VTGQNGPRAWTETKRNFPPARKLAHGGKGHREVDGITKVGDSDGSAELDGQPRENCGRARHHAPILEIVVGPDAGEAKRTENSCGVRRKLDQLRERIAIENMKRVMNTDFAAESVE
jgi:hypothetical protein